MFADTSAIVAILAEEAEAATYLDKIEQAARVSTGAHVRLETTINLARILGLEISDANDLFDAFLSAAGIEVIAITDAVAQDAVTAFARYGKGYGKPAVLNFGDCLSYACAMAIRSPILFKGRDFSRTDLQPA